MLRRPIRLPGEAEADVRRLHPEPRRKVRAALDELRLSPTLGKELGNELAGCRSLRLSRLRIVYRLVGDEVQVIAVGRRETVYEEAARRITAER